MNNKDRFLLFTKKDALKNDIYIIFDKEKEFPPMKVLIPKGEKSLFVHLYGDYYISFTFLTILWIENGGVGI